MDNYLRVQWRGLTQKLLDAGLAPNFGHFPLQGLLVVGRQGEDFEGQRRPCLLVTEEMDGCAAALPNHDVTTSLTKGGELCHVPHCDGRCGWGRDASAGCDGRRGHFATSTQHRLVWCSCSWIFDCIGSVYKVMKQMKSACLRYLLSCYILQIKYFDILIELLEVWRVENHLKFIPFL